MNFQRSSSFPTNMGTSFASCNSLNSTKSKGDLSSPRSLKSVDEEGNSIADSLTSLSIQSTSPVDSVMSISMTSQQFNLSLTEDRLKEELKSASAAGGRRFSTESRQSKRLSLSSSPSNLKMQKFKLRFPFRRRSKVPDLPRRGSNAEGAVAKPEEATHQRSMSLSVGDFNEASAILEKFKVENDALSLEVRGKAEELQLLNATLDQVNQNWESQVLSLRRNVEVANKKYEHLRNLIAAKEAAASEANNNKSGLRLPLSDPPVQRRNHSGDHGENSSKQSGSESPKATNVESPVKSPPSTHRKGVREERKKAATARPFDKTDEVRERLLAALLSSRCLSQLPQEQLNSIVNVMKCKRINKGERLMQEGSIGQAFYVLDDGEGECRMYRRNQESATSQLSQNGILVKPWTVFGDSDVFYHTRRVWSCKCVRQGQVWYVTREDFRSAAMHKNLQTRKKEISDFLKKLPHLSTLNPSRLRKLTQMSRIEQFGEGDYVIRQGDYAGKVYVIKAGEVHVTKQIDGLVTPQKILTPGQIFGDGLGPRYECNVVAIGNETVQCIAIPLKDFDIVRECMTSQKDGVTSKKIHENFALRIMKGDGADSDITTSNSSGYASDGNSPRVTRRKYSGHYEVFSKIARDLKDKERSDFSYIATIGNGAFGSVDLVASNNNDDDVYAMKKISKEEIQSYDQQRNVVNEKKIQIKTSQDCPFITSLYTTFRDNRFDYFVMEYCPGGELFSLLSKVRFFDDDTARFYAACVVEALTYLHAKHIVYRDLKPENIVIDKNGYCKLTDFGFAKQLSAKSTFRTYTYCGTAEYMAPETIMYSGHTVSVDLWSLGVFIFEIVVGKAPFRNKDRDDLAEAILQGITGPLDAAKSVNRISEQAASIVNDLCQLRPGDRLGSSRNGLTDVTRHPWFDRFDWISLRKRTLTPPWRPKLNSPSDLRYFDTARRARQGEYEFSGWDENF
ncbi:cGMP-dependent protein kinase 1-like isoform X2 [Clavelina lepadiformis]